MIPRLLWWLLIALAAGLLYLLASFVFHGSAACADCGEGVVLTLIYASPVIAGIAIFSSVRQMRAFRIELWTGVVLATAFVFLASYSYLR
jgi:diacylglycerol kinase